MAVDAYIALGSNIGDRFAQLQRAVRSLDAHPEVSIVRASPIYESVAHTLTSDEKQADYLNAVVVVRTRLSPRALLDLCLAIERDAGRRRSGRWEPRPIDLDLIAYGEDTVDIPELTVPHPRVGQRRFVLQPLADVAPELWLPSPYDAAVYSLLERTPDAAGLRRIPQKLRISR